MIDQAAHTSIVSQIEEHLAKLEAERALLKEHWEAAGRAVAEVRKELGYAKAQRALSEGVAIDVKDLRDWFYLHGIVAVPEKYLSDLLDKGYLATVEKYIAGEHNPVYPVDFFSRLLDMAEDLFELGRSKTENATLFLHEYHKAFDEKVLASEKLGGRKIFNRPRSTNIEVILKLAAAHYSNVAEYCGDFELLKKLVAVNPLVLHNVKSDITGRVLKMRELVAINKTCAFFASQPISNDAGVGSRDSPEEKIRKVHQHLTVRGERKAFKSEIKAPVQAKQQAPKKKFKI